jgi:hydrogenase maturation protease
VSQSRGLVLGVGNLLWADEGFGVRCVEAFAAKYAATSQLTVADGGTQGLYLVDLLRTHDPIVIFDAVDFGDEPGAIRVVENEGIPAFVAARKVSLHQAGLQDVIACARLLGGCAENMLLVGVQPVELEDYGGSLRAAVKARIPSALDIARDYLAGFGIILEANSGDSCEQVITPGLDIENYESGRPDQDSACRFGDARVLRRTGSD